MKIYKKTLFGLVSVFSILFAATTQAEELDLQQAIRLTENFFAQNSSPMETDKVAGQFIPIHKEIRAIAAYRLDGTTGKLGTNQEANQQEITSEDKSGSLFERIIKFFYNTWL